MTCSFTKEVHFAHLALTESTRIPTIATRTYGVLLAVSKEGRVREIWCLIRQEEGVLTQVLSRAKAVEVAKV